jgi:primosomal protein N' (replication factor Y)
MAEKHIKASVEKGGMGVKKKAMNGDLSYVEVAVPLPVHQTFTYHVPDDLSSLISVGKRVLVSFGRRRLTGYILGRCSNSAGLKTKPVLDVLDQKPLFLNTMVPFFKWIADYYMYPIGETIRWALPAGLNLFDFDLFHITEKGRAALVKKIAVGPARSILNLLKEEPKPFKALLKNCNNAISNADLLIMEKRGWIGKTKKLSVQKTKPKLKRFVSITEALSDNDRGSTSKKRILAALMKKGEMSVKDLTEMVSSAPRVIKVLQQENRVKIFDKQIYRDPFGEPITPDIRHELTTDQQKVIAAIFPTLDQGFSTFLLAGVTGSGKTEVYMQVVEEVLKRGRAALVLVPEIALISQMGRCFRARFGDCVALLHSGLTAGERYDQWSRIISKKARIAIGARSAIFAPLSDIGLIVVDEEHDPSYKQENQLRYNARDLAVVRARHHDCVVLLGSATPSIQSYYNVKIGKFRLLKLPARIQERPLAEVAVVDLKKSKDLRGVRRFITPDLLKAMKETLENKEQVLLFLNRRGFASFPTCAACGEPMKCKNCDISLTHHQTMRAFVCHYCGFTCSAASHCRECGSPRIKLLGLGTEKVEAAVKALFPKANVARMDRDTTRRKGAILKLLKGLKNRTIDILVGTQIIAKGHHFSDITLVGIICADLSLNFPDFRAGERTFQLLAQVSGRAGRGDVHGRVILQTYNPEHFTISAARTQDFTQFYNQEIQYRKALHYPPFSRIIQIQISGKDKNRTEKAAKALGERCHELQNSKRAFLDAIAILGPIEAPLFKIANRYRWQLLFKCANVKMLHQFSRALFFQKNQHLKSSDVHTSIDVDPYFMM